MKGLHVWVNAPLIYCYEILVDPEKRAEDHGASVVVKRTDDKALCLRKLMVAPDSRRWLYTLNPRCAPSRSAKSFELESMKHGT